MIKLVLTGSVCKFVFVAVLFYPFGTVQIGPLSKEYSFVEAQKDENASKNKDEKASQNNVDCLTLIFSPTIEDV